MREIPSSSMCHSESLMCDPESVMCHRDVSSRAGDVSSRIRSPQADERGIVRCLSACITVRGISTIAESNDVLCVLCLIPAIKSFSPRSQQGLLVSLTRLQQQSKVFE